MAFTETNGPPLITPTGVYGPPSFSEVMAKPNSQKRNKPSDLFRFVTDRTVFSSREDRTLYVRRIFEGNTTYGFLSSGISSNIDLSHVVSDARGKILDKVKRQNVNLAQTLVEYRQSADLLLKLSQELLQGWRALRRFHFGELLHNLRKDKGFSKKWIEYQFGILPLVSDLDGTLKSLADKISKGTYVFVQASATDWGTRKTTVKDPEGQFFFEDAVTITHTCKINARYMVKDDKLEDLKRFGFLNAPALGWELVPFSFVVDWLLPVGDYLNRLDALAGTTDFSFNQSEQIMEAAVRTSTSDGATATGRSTRRLRSINNTSLSIPLPRYEPSQSLRKIVTATALLRMLRH